MYEFDQQADPTTQPTLDAAITNLFYWHNIVHDIFYRAGPPPGAVERPQRFPM